MNPRLIALTGVVAMTVLLPLAGASAGPVGDGDAEARPTERQADATPGAAPEPDAKQPATDDSSLLPDLGLDTSAQCGPELTSPKGIEAQTCVLTRQDETWGRTYYRNTTGDELSAVLTLMGPAGRTVQTHCAVGAADEPGACETPREGTAADADAYAAVAEFADGSGGPLLLRSGSNSGRP
ncbi:hypothetical protein GCM10010277_43130 [Streptomyces longisporoflavus]|uniref:hypothetical protein n=1 Tax=Streptomyces longisporoflavus TaxID=28044 RepID=UPI00167CA62C|nr:hypothetical protein [Streptomyces longisporoflavus]GGV49356.1 hypothetical protein GCM10010277_43130 [Streptomyces longisporoflavus]